MRIVHIITRLIIGGAQENTLLCCRELMNAYGDDVLLVTGPTCGPEGSLMEAAKDSRVPLEIIPQLQRAIHPWRDWVSLRQLKSTLRRYGPDVVHTHSAKGGVLGRMAATSLDIPAVIHTVHGAPFHPYQNWLARSFFRWCEKYAADKCHAFVTVSDSMTELLVGSGVAPREKFNTVYSGMDVRVFLDAERHRHDTRRKLGYEDQHIVVGKVARLFHLKGHQYVLRAASQIIRQVPSVRFLFVGDGILRATLEREIERAGLNDFFQFVGLVEPGRMPAVISAVDIVVHASLREGLARVLPQSLLVGRPVVSYDVDGACEVVDSGRTGFLVPPQSIDEMAAAIVKLANSSELRKRMAQEGRRHCEHRFDYQPMTKQLRALYIRQLHGRGAEKTSE